MENETFSDQKYRKTLPIYQTNFQNEQIKSSTSESIKSEKQKLGQIRDLSNILAINFDKLFNNFYQNCDTIIRYDSKNIFSFSDQLNLLDHKYSNDIFIEKINETLKIQKSYTIKPRAREFTWFLRMLFEPFYYIFTEANHLLDLNEFTQTINFLKNCKSICFTSAPHSNFLYPESIDCYNFSNSFEIDQDEYLKKFIPHGLSSNGKFIFVLLCPNILYIFPLFYNASIIEPKIITLCNITLTRQSSIVAFPNFVEIYLFPNSGIKKIILIDDLLSSSTKCDRITTEKTHQILFKITNGISCISARAERDSDEFALQCVTQEIKTNNVLKKVTLKEMRSEKIEKIYLYPDYSMSKDIPELHPNHEFTDIPIETNGSTISFIYKTSQNDAIHRSFSLLTGEMLSDEKFSFVSTKTEDYFENNDNPFSNLTIPKTPIYVTETNLIPSDGIILNNFSMNDILAESHHENTETNSSNEINNDKIDSNNENNTSNEINSCSIDSNNSSNEVNNGIANEIISITIDCINNCRWCLVIQDKNVYLRKMAYFGGIDPLIFHIRGIQNTNAITDQYSKLKLQYLGILNYYLRYSCCSFRPILFYNIDDVNIIIDLLKGLQNYTNTSNSSELLALQQIATMIVSMNIKNITKTHEKIVFETIERMQIIELIFFLFFQNFAFLLDLNKQLTSQLLFKLIKRPSDSDELLNYAFRIVENTDQFAYVSKTDGLFDLIKDNEMKVCSLLIIHQRVLIRTVYNYINSINPFAVIDESNLITPIDYFSLYVKELFALFEKSLKRIKEKTLVSILFNNFIKLALPLHKHHIIAHIINTSLSTILNPFSRFLDNDIYKSDAVTVIYAYGKFAITLLSGGFPNEFEEHFSWFRAYSPFLFDDSFDNLNEDVMKSYPYLKTMLRNYNLLEFWYKNQEYRMEIKYRDEQLRYIEAFAVMGLTKQTGCMDELLTLIQKNVVELPEISEQLYSCLCQMDRIGQQYSIYLKNDEKEQLDNLTTKYLLLLKFPNIYEGYLTAETFADFILSPFTLDYIMQSLEYTKTKAKATIAEYERITNILNSINGTMFNDILEYSISNSITTFKGLQTIFQITGIPNQTVISLLTKILESPFKRMRIIVFKFFLSIRTIPNILNPILSFSLNLFKNNQDDYSLYALSLSLIHFNDSLKTIPNELFPLNNEIFALSLLEASIFQVSSFLFYDPHFQELKEFILDKKFLNNPYQFKIILRIRRIFITLGAITETSQIVLSYLSYIGQNINNWNNTINQNNAIEMIYFLRSPFAIDLIHYFLTNNNEQLDKSIQLGICSVLGYQMEQIRPFSLIVTQNNQLYISACNSRLNESLTFYQVPFDISNQPLLLDSKSSSAQVIPDARIDNSSFIGYLINMLKRIYAEKYEFRDFLPIVSQAICMYFENNPNISLPPDLIEFMCSMIIPFDDINHTLNQISLLDQKAHESNILNDIDCNFGVINNRLNMTTYLSETIKPNSPLFTLKLRFNIKISSQNIDQKVKDQTLFQHLHFYFGIVSDNVESEQTLVSLISYPDGTLFPDSSIAYSFAQPETYYSLNYIDLSVSFIVNPETRSFFVQQNAISFPQGDSFRLCILMEKIHNVSVHPSISLFVPSDNINELVFDQFSFPSTSKIIDHFKEKFIDFPDLTKLKSNYHDYKEINEFVKELPPREKLKYMHFKCPFGFPIHIDESTNASLSIINHQLNGLYLKLGQQWLTIGLAYLARFNPSLISKHAFKLYSVLSIPMEIFNQNEFIKGNFPYSLEKPSWMNSLFDKRIPIQDILLSILHNDDCLENIFQGLQKKSSLKNIHYIALPHKCHKYVDNHTICLGDECLLATFNDFKGEQKNVANLIADKQSIQIDFPIILNEKHKMYYLQINEEYFTHEISLLFPTGINADYSLHNGWIIDTPLEILVHLKNLLFAPLKNHHFQIIKSIVIEMLIGQSPFVLKYLDQIVSFLLKKLPHNFEIIEKDYLKRLVALGCFLKSHNNMAFISLYDNEMSMIKSTTPIQ